MMTSSRLGLIVLLRGAPEQGLPAGPAGPSTLRDRIVAGRRHRSVDPPKLGPAPLRDRPHEHGPPVLAGTNVESAAEGLGPDRHVAQPEPGTGAGPGREAPTVVDDP